MRCGCVLHSRKMATFAAPQPGVNIVVTTYTDGTTQAAKVMK